MSKSSARNPTIVTAAELESVPAGTLVCLEGTYAEGHPEMSNFEGVMIKAPRGMPSGSRLRVTGVYWPGKDCSDPRTPLAPGYNGASLEVVSIEPLTGGYRRTTLFAGADVALVWVEPQGTLELVAQPGHRFGADNAYGVATNHFVLPMPGLIAVEVISVPSILDSVSSLRFVGPFGRRTEITVTPVATADAREVARVLGDRFGVARVP